LSEGFEVVQQIARRAITLACVLLQHSGDDIGQTPGTSVNRRGSLVNTAASTSLTVPPANGDWPDTM